MGDVIKHIRRYDELGKREENNYIKSIEKETGWGHNSIVKCIQILEDWDLIEKKKEGRKKIIHFSPYNGHSAEKLE